MIDPNDMPFPLAPREPAEGSPELHRPTRPTVVVGIGASAGGLAAFTDFLQHMPPDSGMAFVLVQHLDPRQPSLLPELLALHTRMPVHPVVDRMPIAPDHVYLIPPNTTLTIDQGRLCLTAPHEARGHRMPIDRFFYSLATNQGDHAVGIILSGTGTDGTLGLAAIRECGGLTLAQAPDSAQYDAMPQSAIVHGVVDQVLPVAQMPAALYVYAQARAPYLSLSAAREAPAEIEAALQAISAILQQATGHDFSHYKPATRLRRIARRMQVVRTTELADYVARLRQDRKETDRLFQDLLISVTHFFRDPAAFEALAATVIPQLFRAKDASTPVRVWVPGCATGEEAYSIAILLREHLGPLTPTPPVQVFATDIDEPALDVARQGRYDNRIAALISAERLARFFVHTGGTYQVTKPIRELCLFSSHNLIGDPPFARLDLIVCRNLLIYFDAELQHRLIPLLHYALAPQGYLFLGSSESVAAHGDLFRTVDKQHRIYQRQEPSVRTFVDFPFSTPRRRPSPPLGVARHAPAKPADIGALLDSLLLKQYAPPAAVVDEHGAVVAFSGRTGGYLQPPAGPPNTDLLAMAHPQLRLALQAALRTTIKEHTPTIRENLAIEIAGGVQRLNLIVRPLAEQPGTGLLLVVFQELGPSVSAVQAQAAGLVPPIDEPIAEQLAQELQTTRDALETTIAEFQEANAELMSANEELLSINEELQAANEELQISKEEIQSINEELQTVNAELNRKIEQLDRANGDLQNLFASTQIPALFLHADGRIARFTPAATVAFRLIEGDLGRPITDIAAHFHADDLMQRVGAVLHTLTPYEAPVQRVQGDIWWILRIQPYRTLANVIDGVVMTFADITNLKQAEAEREQLLAAVQQARLFAERIVETVPQPLLVLGADQRVQAANRAFYQTFQATPAETEQILLYELGSGQWDQPEIRARLGALLGQHNAFEDVLVTHAFPHIGTRTMLLSARLLEQPLDGAPVILLAIEDITTRVQAALALRQAHDVLEERIQERTRALATVNATLRAEIGERMQAEQSRQMLLRQLVTAQEEERRRIARELHDQMGQDLTALMLGLKTLRNTAAVDSPAQARLEQVHALAGKIGREVRSLAVHLRPPALDELGLAATLANEVEQWSARTLIAVDFQTIGLADQRLPAALETTLYRVVQEALTNVLKHAQATRVSLIIERRTDAVHMIVEDDGAGFDADAVRYTAHAEHRLGLVGMAERVAQVGGTLTIEATPGRGTTVFVRIPCTEQAQGDSDGETADLSGR